jgi:hypothetical protein
VPLSATLLIVRGRPAETDTEQHRGNNQPARNLAPFHARWQSLQPGRALNGFA